MSSYFRRSSSSSGSDAVVRRSLTQDEELEAAFACEEDAPSLETEQSTLLEPAHSTTAPSSETDATPRPYDFEANFASSSSTSVTQPTQSSRAASTTRTATIRERLAQTLFGQQLFSRLSTADPDQHVRSHSRQDSHTRDGVFANLAAKPERRPGLLGDEYVGGDDEGNSKEMPPTYEAAAADSTPPYWETTIIAPPGAYLTGSGGPDEVLVDGLPVGNLFAFAWNALVSMSFQFVGFLLTYLLHTSHAAKHGSRAGLGITLIQYSFYLRSRALALKSELAAGQIPPELVGMFPPISNSTASSTPHRMLFGDGDDPRFPKGWPWAPAAESSGTLTATATNILSAAPSQLSALPEQQREGLTQAMKMSSMANDWMSYLLMVLGWGMLFVAVVSYYKAWKFARALRSDRPSERTAEQIEIIVT